MLTLLRRLLVVVALAFWLGGFTFYAAVVVPVGAEVLGSEKEQGLVTRKVTKYLNLAGAIALAPLAWDVAVAQHAGIWKRLLRWLSWLGMALTLAALLWLHPRVDELLDPETYRILERGEFRTRHRWYLWISTIQWVFGVIYLLLTLQAWRQAGKND